MYFYEEETGQTFSAIRKLMQNSESLLWLDYTSKKVVADETNIPEVENFMANMRRMGEPFIQGYETILTSENSRLFEMKHLTSSDYCVDEADAIYGHYSFCILAPALHPDNNVAIAV
jgi:O-methyltransferase involved in polyketide biosynthesis